jgi:hypothetical protein
MSTVLDPTLKGVDNDNQGHAHIYEDNEYPKALCGHISSYPIDENPALPHDVLTCSACLALEEIADFFDNIT